MPECLSGFDIPATLGHEGGPSSFIVEVFAGHICHVLAVYRFFELNGDICLGLKLPRSSQHAVGNLQGFLVGFYLTSDIQHCRDRATNLIVLHGASMLRIAYNGYL